MRTSTGKVSRLSGKVQDFLAASTGFGGCPDGHKKIRVEIVVEDLIWFGSLKNIFKFSNMIL